MNKRKVLDAARKYAQKGAKEKALKEYGKLLKADSRDAKLLLEIGDSHRRWGQNEEAISHYNKVAEQYKQGGFDARAVAVFKQIINLDSKRYAAYVSLSDLYQRMGLDAEAVNALQAAADGYNKDGQKVEALELLRKMATVDPSNTLSRMKVADLLRQEGMLDDAVAEYEAVAEELVRQGANDELIPVYERILEIRPERPDIEFSLARNLVQLSESERAELYARRAFDHDPDGEGHFDLLNGIYTELGRTEQLADVTRQMAQLYRDRGDESLAGEVTQRRPDDDVRTLGEDSDTGFESSGGDYEMLDDDFLGDDFL
ncbi:MAG: tetratricopeptide repeat protein, partial [bacterium]|nr:tetratricopeptide repeat protein [bacterium]